MRSFWLVAVALALAPLTAPAAGPTAVRKQAESSMLVEGTIDFNAQGTVEAVALKKEEALPAGVAAFVRERVERWTFEPVLVDGEARPARTGMTLRVVARRRDDKGITVGIRNATFSGTEPPPGAAVTSISMKPPHYPIHAVHEGVTGTVYLLLKVGRTGRVEDAAVEQVNLKVVARDGQMTFFRKLLGDASLKAAREWTFKTPTIGELANYEFWPVRVPTDFIIDPGLGDGYGEWQAYVPGPRQRAAWSAEPDDPAFAPDALAGGGVYTVGAAQGARLLTPLDEG